MRKTVVNPSPGQLRSQLCDLQCELQVNVFTLSHRSQQAAVLLTQLAVSVLQFSHCAQQVFSITEAKQTVSVVEYDTLIIGGKHMQRLKWNNWPGTRVAFWGSSFALRRWEIQPWKEIRFSELPSDVIISQKSEQNSDSLPFTDTLEESGQDTWLPSTSVLKHRMTH